MSTLTLSAGVMFIIRHSATAPADDDSESEAISKNELPAYLHRAIWCVAESLAMIMLSTAALALLDRTRDTRGTLRVNTRSLRLSGRAVYLLIVLLMPLQENLNAELFLGTCGLLLMFLSTWEFVVSAHKGGEIFEPKSRNR